MAKMLAKTAILMPDGAMVAKGAVFDATPAQAKQLDALNAARPAMSEEVSAAARAQAAADGHAFEEAPTK